MNHRNWMIALVLSGAAASGGSVAGCGGTTCGNGTVEQDGTCIASVTPTATTTSTTTTGGSSSTGEEIESPVTRSHSVFFPRSGKSGEVNRAGCLRESRCE